MTTPGKPNPIQLCCYLMWRPTKKSVNEVVQVGKFLQFSLKLKSREMNTKVNGSVTVTADDEVFTGSIGDPSSEEYVDMGLESCKSFVNNDKTTKYLDRLAKNVDLVDYIVPSSVKSVDIKLDLKLPGTVINRAGINVEESNIQNVTDALQTLLNDPIHSDFTLVCEDKSFPCHKAILASRSETFKKMFSASMVEAQSGQADLKMKVETVEAMLEFIYTGKVTVKATNESELLEAADMYQLPGLVAHVFNQFKTLDSVEKVADILIIADR